MYAKIFDSMYEGTLYGHWEAIVTLQQMLVLCDSAGVIDMTPQAIAARTSIPLEIINKGIEILSAPDPYSRTPGDDGRRIATLDQHRPWGWYIVNHAKYQKLKSAEEKREADRERMAEKRKANKNSSVADSRQQSLPVESVAEVAHSDSDVYADVNTNSTSKATPAAKAADQAQDEIWATGLQLLSDGNGATPATARTFLGKLLKQYGQVLVLQAIRDCVATNPVEAKAWLVARCQERRKENGNGKFNPTADNRAETKRSKADEAMASRVDERVVGSGTA